MCATTITTQMVTGLHALHSITCWSEAQVDNSWLKCGAISERTARATNSSFISSGVPISKAGWASIAKGGVHIDADTLSQRSKPKRSRSRKLGPAWVLGPEDRSDLEANMPKRVEIESIEPSPSLALSLFMLRLSISCCGRYCV